MTTRRFGRALAALAVLASAACSRVTTEFEPGVDPWDNPATSPPEEWPPWPTASGTVGLVTVTGARLASGSTPSHHWAHGRVLLAAPIADVWSALQWQSGVVVAVYPDDQVDCEATNRPEPGFELSYGVKEIPQGGVLQRANWFRVNWRGEAMRDGAMAIQKVNLKAQKVDGTVYVELMRQSVVAVPAPGGGTQLEIVRHINAPGESATTAADWIRLWAEALDAQTKGTPLAPLTRCAFP